jgi:hypothetical protein
VDALGGVSARGGVCGLGQHVSGVSSGQAGHDVTSFPTALLIVNDQRTPRA